MKILNLVIKDKSDIDYNIINYPDGQKDIIIKDWPQWHKDDNIVQIKTRLNNFEDLGLLACAKAALQRLGIKVVHLYAPYIIGSRSDRQFVEGGTSYLVDIVAPFINRLNFESVTCLDPHSDVLEACLNGFKKISLKDIIDDISGEVLTLKPNSFILVSPDAGASKKIYKLADQIGYKGDIITCSKDRDENGKLTRTQLPMFSIMKDKDYIIIDDICDGGATFINIAKIIKGYRHFNGKIYLIVTHSIFSHGTDELLSYFDGIYTTNSYKQHNVEKIKILNVF